MGVEQILGPVQDQQVLLTADPFLQPLVSPPTPISIFGSFQMYQLDGVKTGLHSVSISSAGYPSITHGQLLSRLLARDAICIACWLCICGGFYF